MTLQIREVQTREVQTRADLEAFIRLPWHLYRSDPNWVPPLLSEMRQTLGGKNNPLFHAGPHAAFVAWQEGRPVGRILCGIHEELNRAKGQAMGYFSLFESVEDRAVAAALLETAESWLAERGAEWVQGPVSPTYGDDYRGLLVEGFDGPPALMDSYNPPFYADFFDAAGYRKRQDLWAFHYDAVSMPERVRRVAEYAMKRYGFTVSGLRLAALKEDLMDIKRIVDRAMPEEWEDLAPPSLEDIDAEARRLRPLADPDLVTIARAADGEPIGFSVGLPNYNEVLKRLNGRLFPLGWLKFLFYRRRIKGVRVFILFVVPEWRKKAVTGAMFNYTMQAALRKGYTWGEGSTIGETNRPMVRDAEGAGGVHYKTYRIYEKPLQQGV